MLRNRMFEKYFSWVTDTVQQEYLLHKQQVTVRVIHRDGRRARNLSLGPRLRTAARTAQIEQQQVLCCGLCAAASVGI